MIVTADVLEQPFASLTVIVYVAAHKALTVLVVAAVVTVDPVDQIYV